MTWKVLTAAVGDRDDDFAHTVPGELVTPLTLVCDTDGCGCDRSFAGLSSRMATTVAVVAERPLSDMALIVADVRKAALDTLARRDHRMKRWYREQAELESELMVEMLYWLNDELADVDAGTQVRIRAHADDGELRSSGCSFTLEYEGASWAS